MSLGLIGKKMGMTRIFTEAGVSVSVTVVHVPANCVTQVKTPDSDGYFALQLSVGECKPSRLSKPMAGHFKKSGVNARRSLREFRIDEEELRADGDQVKVNSFSVGEKVNVTGISKGKGFAGVIKRYHFHTQDATHGNSLSHRSAGSIGQCQTPGKVFKGKKMAGHLGSERVTIKNLTVVKVDEERELLLLKGAVPGAPGGEVLVRHLMAVPPPPPEKEAVPEEAAPEEAAPKEAAPKEAAPKEAAPEEAAPEEAAPQEAAPQEAAPEEAAPKEAAAEEAVPEQEQAAAAEAAPENSADVKEGQEGGDGSEDAADQEKK